MFPGPLLGRLKDSHPCSIATLLLRFRLGASLAASSLLPAGLSRSAAPPPSPQLSVAQHQLAFSPLLPLSQVSPESWRRPTIRTWGSKRVPRSPALSRAPRTLKLNIENRVPQAGHTQQLDFLAFGTFTCLYSVVPLSNASTMTAVRAAAKTMPFRRGCGSGDGSAFQRSSRRSPR